MTDRARLQEDVRRVIQGNAEGLAYHGPSTLSNLVGITHVQASAHPIPGAHSIWELVAHLKAGRDWSLARFTGAKPELEWWPPVAGTGPESWAQLLRSLDETFDHAMKAIQDLTEDTAEHGEAAVRFLVHHELYHSGQIALLRKALGMEGRPG
jgi:hypothetical protein